MKLGLHQLAQSAAADGQVPGWDADTGIWVPMDLPSGGITGLTSADASVTITDNGDGTLDLAAAGGGGGGGTYHGASASRATTQSVSATGSGTAIAFDVADEWDTDSIHNPASNNTRFTIPDGLGGHWQFIVDVGWASSSNGRRINWALNGTAYGADHGVLVTPNSASTLRQQAVIELLLSAGDYVECLCNPSTTQNITDARLTCHYLGA